MTVYKMHVPDEPPPTVTRVRPAGWEDGWWERRDGDVWVRGNQRKTWPQLVKFYADRGLEEVPADTVADLRRRIDRVMREVELIEDAEYGPPGPRAIRVDLLRKWLTEDVDAA